MDNDRYELEDAMFYNKHYIKLREDNAIVDGWSDGLFPDRDTFYAICINDKASYQFRLVFHEQYTPTFENPDGTISYGTPEIRTVLSEENISLFDFYGIPLYKYANSEVVRRTEVEMEDDKNKLPPYLPEIKATRQEENKKALAKFLSEHPILWKDNKYYGVTEDDQREMSLNLMQYQLAVGAGIPATLEWHSVKAACTQWTLEEFTELALAITDYVYPYLRYQESIKEKIYACETKDDVYAIEIDYESVV